MMTYMDYLVDIWDYRTISFDYCSNDRIDSLVNRAKMIGCKITKITNLDKCLYIIFNDNEDIVRIVSDDKIKALLDFRTTYFDKSRTVILNNFDIECIGKNILNLYTSRFKVKDEILTNSKVCAFICALKMILIDKYIRESFNKQAAYDLMNSIHNYSLDDMVLLRSQLVETYDEAYKDRLKLLVEATKNKMVYYDSSISSIDRLDKSKNEMIRTFGKKLLLGQNSNDDVLSIRDTECNDEFYLRNKTYTYINTDNKRDIRLNFLNSNLVDGLKQQMCIEIAKANTVIAELSLEILIQLVKSPMIIKCKKLVLNIHDVYTYNPNDFDLDYPVKQSVDIYSKPTKNKVNVMFGVLSFILDLICPIYFDIDELEINIETFDIDCATLNHCKLTVLGDWVAEGSKIGKITIGATDKHGNKVDGSVAMVKKTGGM